MKYKYGINWHGAVMGQSGYEQLTRGILIALDKLGVKVSLKNIHWNKETIQLTSDVAGRLQRMKDTPVIEGAPLVVMQKWHKDIPETVNDVYIYSLFETDKIPSSWISGFQKAKKVFTFSDYNHENWLMSCDNIVKIGFGIEDCFRHCDDKANILNKQGFTFLSVGDWTERKGFDILLDAYCEEFTANDNVTLILKVHMGGFTAMHKAYLKKDIDEFLSKYKNRPRILLCMDKMYYDDMPRLYNACDCFVLATRGEGLGLPIAEAIARGLPVIVTHGSGHMDFVKDGVNGYVIKSEEKAVDNIEYIRKCPEAVNSKWFEPDKEDLKEKMRMIYDDAYCSQMGRASQKEMFDKQWNDVAVQLLKELFK
jgi:glycosyltransferase involved in cell wall biosynthesis